MNRRRFLAGASAFGLTGIAAVPGLAKTPTVPIDRLRRHVEVLAGEIGERNVFRPNALESAARYVEDVWRDQGYEVHRETYMTKGMEVANLIVERRGSSRPDEILVVGAHYDSVHGCPGANDNGSGVAATLEITRAFATLEPDRTVRFVAFVNEEPPFFMTKNQGSVVHARAARKRGDDIRLMVSIETIAYFTDEPGSQSYPPPIGLFFPDTGNFIGIVSDLGSRHEKAAFVEAFQASCDVPVEHLATFRFIPGVSWSDHYPFWVQGYPALMITDTAPYRYPWYHHPGDTPDKLTYPEFARVTKGILGAVWKLATL